MVPSCPRASHFADDLALLCGPLGWWEGTSYINLRAFQWPVLCPCLADNHHNGHIKWKLFPYFRGMKTEAQEIKESVCGDWEPWLSLSPRSLYCTSGFRISLSQDEMDAEYVVWGQETRLAAPAHLPSSPSLHFLDDRARG